MFSKTVWFNVVTGVVALASAFTGTLPQYAGIFVGVLTVGNFVLRTFFTNTGLTLRPLASSHS